HVLRTRLPGAASAAGADHERSPRRLGQRTVAISDRCRAGRAAAAPAAATRAAAPTLAIAAPGPRSNLGRPQQACGDAVRPLAPAGGTPVGVFGLHCQPMKEIMMLVGPIGEAVKHASGARFDGKSPAVAEAGQASAAADPRRVLRQSKLLGADLQAQAPRLSVNADV